MVPTLIDLHVRPPKTEEGGHDLPALASAAREAGLDGLVLFAQDAAIDVAGAEDVTKQSGVHFYAGVELDTDVGRVLCLPGEADEWYRAESWRELANGAGPEAYPSAALVEAFSTRGGAVIVAQPFDRDLDHPCAEAAFSQTSGLVAVIVASNPRHAMSNERALSAARSAGLACVAGSASAPGTAAFGKVATLFSTPPTSQAALIKALQKGRVWPAEIGYQVSTERSKKRNKNKESAQQPREAKPQNSRRGRRRRGDDDNRGNRLDLSRKDRPLDSQYDKRQPDFDPIARLYGKDARKDNPLGHLSHLSDDELDRINGNRTRGNDPNIMSRPDFTELRAERHHISLLLKTIDPHRHDQNDSIAMRFAVHNLGDGENAESAPPQNNRGNHRGNHGGGRSRRRRNRRRRD